LFNDNAEIWLPKYFTQKEKEVEGSDQEDNKTYRWNECERNTRERKGFGDGVDVYRRRGVPFHVMPALYCYVARKLQTFHFA
jgi:hypothetical protein